MKFFLSFVALLVVILVYVRFFPSAPINPVLPIGPQKEVNGHDAQVPKGAKGEPSGAEREETPGSTSVRPAAPGQNHGPAFAPEGAVPHYAKDAGRSAQEIAAVTHDEQPLTFLAEGVQMQA